MRDKTESKNMGHQTTAFDQLCEFSVERAGTYDSELPAGAWKLLKRFDQCPKPFNLYNPAHVPDQEFLSRFLQDRWSLIFGIRIIKLRIERQWAHGQIAFVSLAAQHLSYRFG